MFYHNKKIMGDTINLSGKEAIEKIKELANEKICMFCTYENNEIVSSPMATQKVEDNGSIWFISDKNSNKNDLILADNRVYLIYADSSKQHYLSLSGLAEIVFDKDKIEALWTPLAKAWFEEGKDDPDISLLKVTPDEGHYWDTKNGKLISTLKIAIAAITGTPMDGAVQGDIKV